MDRTYRLRERVVHVEEVTDVVAIHRASVPASVRHVFQTLGLDAVSAEMLPPATVDHSPFRQAGWLFLPRTAQTTAVAAIEDSIFSQRRGWHVYRRDDGEILIGAPRLIVRLRDDLDDTAAAATFAAHRVSPTLRLGFATNAWIATVEATDHPIDAAARLGADPSVMYAEPDMLERIPQRAAPKAGFSQQWHLRNDGQDGGTPGNDIKAPDAWTQSTGKAVTIGVIDHGFDVGLKHLAPAIVAGAGAFLDNSGGVPQLVASRAAIPRGFHGTFCAGMAMARPLDAKDGRGVAPRASVLPIACLSDEIGSQATLARAIHYAVDPSFETGKASRAADVITCSLGPHNSAWQITSGLADALVFAATKGRNGLGVPVFWAVENSASSIELDEVCGSGLVIPVGASDRHDRRSECAFGPRLAFLAPGVNVYGLFPDGSFRFDTGTSYAAPCAAGIAALMLARNPALTAAQIASIMRRTCDQVPRDAAGTLLVPYDVTGHNDEYGAGRVNAAQAVEAAIAAGA